MDSPHIISLRPDKTLLNTKFDGYKLSLDPVPVLKSSLPAPLHRVFTNDEQYSFLHAKLFSLHNHLFRDPWLANSTYFLDENGVIQNVRYDTNRGVLSSIKSVFKIAKFTPRNDCYNASCCFVSEKFCVFSDGGGSLHVLDTGDRFRNEEWKSLFSATIFAESTPFLLQDARLEITENLRRIDCLLLSVQKKTNDSADDCRFEVVIDWVSLSKVTGASTWTNAHARQLRGKSLPDYCALDPRSSGLLLSADEQFHFAFDTENELHTENPGAENEDESANISFTWTQSDDEVNVFFDIGKECFAKDFHIAYRSSRLNVLHKNKSLMDSELFQDIDHELTTWNLGNEVLQINLMKTQENSSWPSLLKNSDIPPTDQPTNAVRDLSQSFSSRLRTDMEDCDFGENAASEYFFARIDATSHKVTHKINFGANNCILFTAPMRESQPAAFALRSDVDVCVWSLQFGQSVDSASAENFVRVCHEGTLNAFGYIQASKQQKKYLQCSPDFKYAIVCEANRHVFIYKGAHDTASSLKNRSTNTRANIGQQKLITLDESDDVYGIHCENETTFLITKNRFLCLQFTA